MEFTCELKPEDYSAYRRLLPRAWWYPGLAILIVAPSLISLYLGGFRITLYVVAAAIGLLLFGGFRAAGRLRRQEFIRNRCLPLTIRVTPECVEVDGMVEWRRVHWSYIDRFDVRRGWLVISFYEGDPVVVPERCLDDTLRTELLEAAARAMESRAPRETAELSAIRTFDDADPRTEIAYTIDNQYMRGLIELRFADKVGWTRVVFTLAATAVAAALWSSARPQVIAAGVAVAIPLAGLRLLEMALKSRTIQRCDLQQTLAMRLALHDEGYERRCSLFQAFTSWSLVKSVDVHHEYVIFSHLDNEHLLAPAAACQTASRNGVELAVAPEEFTGEAMGLARAWNEVGAEHDETASADDAS